MSGLVTTTRTIMAAETSRMPAAVRRPVLGLQGLIPAVTLGGLATLRQPLVSQHPLYLDLWGYSEAGSS